MKDETDATYAERYPEVADRLLWCVECGQDCAAPYRDWYQLCPKCSAWWAENPPPTEPPAPAANPATADEGQR